ncbi:uncharacterized protein LOC124289728 [Haliotis rubra]|uniref:uncharacterized protein LOC124289728 n=1 Tax=Haliotis rubra TaxID=36100 RepID=UPI001EE4EFF9|nr:uncharacterized protein LOC124289728 [Haliotis rubra]
MPVNSQGTLWRRVCTLCGCCFYRRYQCVQPDEDWLDLLTEEQRQTCVTDRTLFVVSQHIGRGWEVLGMELGLRYVCVDRCATPNSSPQMQTLAMLNTWRQLKGRRATVEELITALQRSIPGCTVDMFAIIRDVCDK